MIATQFTKPAIANAFLKLLGTKKFKDVTIQDICDECGISRRTFYNNFEYIYDLIDYMFVAEMKKNIKASEAGDRGEKMVNDITSICKLAKENKNLVYSIFNSMGRDELEVNTLIESYSSDKENDFDAICNHFYSLGIKSFLI